MITIIKLIIGLPETLGRLYFCLVQFRRIVLPWLIKIPAPDENHDHYSEKVPQKGPKE